MLRQLFTIVLAATVGLTPVAGELCLAACGGGAVAAPGHEHHEVTAPAHHALATDEHQHSATAAHAETHHHGVAADEQSVRIAARDAGSPLLEPDCCGSAPGTSPQVSVREGKTWIDPPVAGVQLVESGSDERFTAGLTAGLRIAPLPPVPLSLRTPLRV